MTSEHFRPSAASRFVALGVGLALALAPSFAEARAGSSSSMGSRGMRTYSAPAATPTAPSVAPMQRSMTAPAQPGYTPPPNQQITPSSPAYGGGLNTARPGFMQRNPFMTGMLGGLVGAGLAGMLFGDGFGGFGIGGLLASVFQIALILGVLYLLLSLFRRRSGPTLATAAGPAFRDTTTPPPRPTTGGGRGPAAVRDQIGLSDRDYAEFERLLVQIQQEWSTANLVAMRQHVTPEMLSYFSEQLAENTSRGVENHVANVIFLKGDLSEAWRERERDYATVAMTWSCRDWTVRAGTTQILEGSDRETIDVTEVWTFLRSVRGGAWVLSAIQQV